jgi:hypothetical protein
MRMHEEVRMAGMEADKGGMESPVVPTDVTGMKVLMERDINDIPVFIHGRTIGLNLFLKLCIHPLTPRSRVP